MFIPKPMVTVLDSLLTRALLLLAAFDIVLAHGHGNSMNVGAVSIAQSPNANEALHLNLTTPLASQSYFARSDYSGLVLGHIAFMTAGWVFILPIGRLRL